MKLLLLSFLSASIAKELFLEQSSQNIRLRDEIQLQENCKYLVDDRDFFNLDELAKEKEYRTVSMKVDADTTQNVVFAFCRDIPESELFALGCDTSYKTMAVLQTQVTGKPSTCVKLSGSAKDASMKDVNYVNDKLEYRYNSPDQGYALDVHVTCVKAELFANEKLTSTAQNVFLVTFDSTNGCVADELSEIWNWMQVNRWGFFAIFLLIGLVMTFLGNFFIMPILFLTGIAQASFLIMLICYSTFTKENREIWVGWVILIVSVIVGLGVGVLFWKKKQIGAFCLASWGGFSFGLLIYNSFLYKFNSNIALWGFTVGMGLLYGILILFWADHILIHATSMIGSFLTIFAIGLVAGHYPNPFTIVELIKYDQIKEIDPLFYAYLGGNIVLYIIGCLVQYRHLHSQKALQKQLKGSMLTTAESNLDEKLTAN